MHKNKRVYTTKDKQPLTLAQLFNEEQFKEIQTLWDVHQQSRTFHINVVEQVVKPAMAHINQVTGQENDPDYIGYLVEYALVQAEKGKK